MSKKSKIILVVVAGMVVLALGGGAIVLAADNPPTTTTPAAQSNTLFAKVATILGVTEQQITDAFKQANTQLENQRIDQLLAQAVTNNTITQAEADALKAWLAQRPATPTKDTLKAWESNGPQLANPNALKGLFGFPGKMVGPIGVASANNTDLLTKVAAILSTATGKSITLQTLQSAFTQAEGQMKTAALEKALANAVTNGKITQTEADQFKAWWNQRPPAVDKLIPNGGFGIPGLGNGGMMPRARGMMRGRGLPPVQPTQPAKPTT